MGTPDPEARELLSVDVFFLHPPPSSLSAHPSPPSPSPQPYQFVFLTLNKARGRAPDTVSSFSFDVSFLPLLPPAHLPILQLGKFSFYFSPSPPGHHPYWIFYIFFLSWVSFSPWRKKKKKPLYIFFSSFSIYFLNVSHLVFFLTTHRLNKSFTHSLLLPLLVSYSTHSYRRP